MKKFFIVLLLIFLSAPLFVSVFSVKASEPGVDSTDTQGEKIDYRVKITELFKKDCADDTVGSLKCMDVEVEFLNKGKKGERMNIELDTRSDLVAKEWKLTIGKQLVVTEYKYQDQSSFQITEIYRANTLLWLGIFYALLVIAIAGKRGFGALIGLGISIAVILEFIIPLTIDGHDPVLISVLGGLFILVPSMYFSHGFNYKTHVALAGTIVGLLLTGILAAIVINITDLTGFGTDQSLFISQIGMNINVTGILLASMLIGGMGLIDDIAIAQVSVINELYTQQPKIKFRKLYKKAMNIGKDHVASVVNTLFLAYAAASIPLVIILVSQGVHFNELVNIEEFAEEIARTIVASSGILLSVPITTMLGAYLFAHKEKFDQYKDELIRRIEER